MAAVCKRRGVTCRLHVKNEAAAVEASPEVVQGLREASEAAEPLMQRLMSQHRQRQPAASTPPGTCSAPPGGGAADSDCAAADAPAAGGGGSGSASGSRAAAGAAPLLVSGAGHDAMVFADVTRMGMLFVRCRCGRACAALPGGPPVRPCRPLQLRAPALPDAQHRSASRPSHPTTLPGRASVTPHSSMWRRRMWRPPPQPSTSTCAASCCRRPRPARRGGVCELASPADPAGSFALEFPKLTVGST